MWLFDGVLLSARQVAACCVCVLVDVIVEVIGVYKIQIRTVMGEATMEIRVDKV